MYKIGIFGSATEEFLSDTKLRKNTEILGKELAAHDCIVITGACPGIPYAVAKAAHDMGAKIWGFTPAAEKEEHAMRYPEQNLSLYEQLIYVPPELAVQDITVRRKYRNVISTSRCDAGIIIAGRWGTLHEFCALHDYGKVIGVLTNTGSIADELQSLMRAVEKETGAEVVFHDDPQELLEHVIAKLDERSGRTT